MNDLNYGHSSNRVQQTLRLKGHTSKGGPLRLANSTDAHSLQALARDLAKGEIGTDELVLTTGFGLNASPNIPVRLPAISIPGLTLMEQLQKEGLPVPTYLLYQATDFISQTSGLDPDQSKESSHRMARYLRSYIDRFHSRVADHVLLQFDCTYSPETENAVKELMADMKSRETHSEGLREAILKIKKFGSKKSSDSHTSEVYAAANAIYNGATHYPFENEIPKGTRVILPIGGLKEEPFFHITSECSRARSGRRVLPLLTPLGSRPVYYHYPDLKDPSSPSDFSNAIEDPHMDAHIKTDLLAMRCDGVTSENLKEIYPNAI